MSIFSKIKSAIFGEKGPLGSGHFGTPKADAAPAVDVIVLAADYADLAPPGADRAAPHLDRRRGGPVGRDPDAAHVPVALGPAEAGPCSRWWRFRGGRESRLLFRRGGLC